MSTDDTAKLDEIVRILAGVDEAKFGVHTNFLQQLGHELDPAISRAIAIAKELSPDASEPAKPAEPASETSESAAGAADELDDDESQRPVLAQNDDLSDDEEPEVDARVEPMLQEMNQASDMLNDVQSQNTQVQKEVEREKQGRRLQEIRKRIGDEKIAAATPYYNALFLKKKAETQLQEHTDSLSAAGKAVESARKAMVLVEADMADKMATASSEDEIVAFLEKLNEANEMLDKKKQEEQTVSQACEQDRQDLKTATETMKEQESAIGKRMIEKTMKYFSELNSWGNKVTKLKDEAQRLESRVEANKSWYQEAMTKLDSLSNEIHKTREERKLERKMSASAASADDGSSSQSTIENGEIHDAKKEPSTDTAEELGAEL